MRKVIFGIILLAATAISLVEDDVLAVAYTCYNDGNNIFCSSAVLDLETLGSYSTAAECAAYCGY